MIGKRFLALALAGLMVATSVNTGSLKVYAQEADQESNLSFADAEGESALSEDADTADESVGDDLSEAVSEGEEVWESAPDDAQGDTLLDEQLYDDTEAVTEDTAESEVSSSEDDALTSVESEGTITLTLSAMGGLFENEEDTLVLNVKANNPLEMSVDAPVKEGYKFTGWFLDEALTEAVDLATYIFTENSVLFAGWQEVATEGEEDESKLMADDYFTLDANGGTFLGGKSTVIISDLSRNIDSGAYQVSNGEKAFTGWYKDKECKERISEEGNLWYFEEEPEFGKTYYAGWEENSYKLTYIIGDDADEYGKTGYYYDNRSAGYPQRLKEVVYYIPAGKSIGWSGDYSPEDYRVRNTDLHLSFEQWYHDNRDETNAIDDLDSYTPEKNTIFYAGFIEDTIIISIHSGENTAYFKYENSYFEYYGMFDTYKERAKESDQYYLSIPQWLIQNDNPRKVLEGVYTDPSCSEETKAFEGYDGYVDTKAYKDFYIKWAEDENAQVITFDLNSEYGEFYDDRTGKTAGRIKETGIPEFDYLSLGDVELSDMHYRLLGFSTDRNATVPDEGWGVKGNKSSIRRRISVNFNLDVELTGSTTFYGVWEKRDGYIVTFDATKEGYFYIDSDTGEPVTEEYYITDYSGWLSSYPIAKAKDPDKEQKCWLYGDEEIESFSIRFVSDTTLKAVYSSSYTVTLDANGGKIFDDITGYYAYSTQKKVAKGNTLNLSAVPILDGKVFDGWYAESECKTYVPYKGFKPEGDCTVYAKWTNSHTVTFDYGDGVVSNPYDYVLSVKEGNTVVSAIKSNRLPNDPVSSVEGKVFSGWFKDAQFKDPVEKADIERYIVTKDTTFYAKYDESCTVTFKARNGFASKPGTECFVKVAKGDTLKGKYPTVKETDSESFTGWNDKDGKPVENIYNYVVTGDVTFTAGYDQGFYTLTFHANRDGAKLDGSFSEIKVKVAKGTAYRYGAGASSVDSLFAAPSLDASGVTDNVVPLEKVNSDGSRTVGWATNPDGSGRIYMFGAGSHVYINEDSTSRSFGMYGFVPTSDMEFYAKWDEPVNLIFTSNKVLFKADSRYDMYGELSADRKQRVMKVPKGTTFACIAAPSTSAFDVTAYAMYYHKWTADVDGKEPISYNTPITDGTKAYLYIYDEVPAGGPLKKLSVYSGEGYFGTPGNTNNWLTYLPAAMKLYTPTIPTINDPARAFDGWYLDEKCTKRLDDTLQYYKGGNWYIVVKPEIKELYAGYSSTYSVTLDANGGYFDNSEGRTKNPDETLREKTKYVVKASPAGKGIRISDYTKLIRRDGNKTFVGWFYEDGKKATITSDGINQEFFDSESGDCTLYAKWEDYVPVTSLSLSTKATTVKIGETVALKAAIEPATAKEQDVHWFISSMAPDQENNVYTAPASITTDGLVTGLALGKIYVYATANGVVSDIVEVTVTDKTISDSISIPEQYQNLDLIKNDKISVKADVTPVSKAGEVTWTSKNPEVASVEGSGDSAIITAASEGETTITASLGKLSASINVKVSTPIKLDKNVLTLTARQGSFGTLEAIVTGKELEGKDVNWSLSEDGDKFVTLEVDTTVTGARKVTVTPKTDLSQAGTVTVTVSVEGAEGALYTDECEVTINVVSKSGPVNIFGADALEEPIEGVDGKVVNDQRIFFGSESLSDTITARVDYFKEKPEIDPVAMTKDYVDAAKDKIESAENTKISGSIDDSYVLISAYAVPVKEGTKEASDVAYCLFLLDQSGAWRDVDERDRYLFGGDVRNVPASGLVVSDVPNDRIYTGEKITFFEDELRVYYNGLLLAPGKDYKVAYANNVNVKVVGDNKNVSEADINKNKLPKVTVTAAGSYQGKAVKCFSINPMPLTEKVEGVDVLYYALSITSPSFVTALSSDKNIAPVPTIVQTLPSGKTVTLKNKTAFNVTYHRIDKDGVHFEENADIKADIAAGKLGDYLINVHGVGNYTGSFADFTVVTPEDKAFSTGAARLQILSAQDVKEAGLLQLGKLKVKKISVAYERDGKEEAEVASKKVKAKFTGEKPEIALKIGGKALKYVTDADAAAITENGYYFTIDDPATDWGDDYLNRYPGTDNYVIIRPTIIQGENVHNLLVGEYKLLFTITGNPISIANLPSSKPYDGKTVVTYKEDGSVDKKATRESLKFVISEKIGKTIAAVKSDDYYDLEVLNDYTVPGTVTLTFTGVKEKGTTGKLVKKIKVGAKKAAVNDFTFEFTETVDPKNVPFSKTGSKPDIVVKDNNLAGYELIEGVDYTVSYSGNKKVGSTGYVSVKFKGNYSGSVKNALSFTVVKAPFSAEYLFAESADKAYKEKAAKGYFKSVPALLDDGKKLALKNEYKYAEDPQYFYAQDYVVGKDVIHAEGDPISDDDVVPAGVLIGVSIKAVPTEKSNYELRGEDKKAGYATFNAFYHMGAANISSFTVKVNNQKYDSYNEVIPSKSDITVTGKIGKEKVTLGSSDYTISVVSNNTKVGTATMIIHGNGEKVFGTKKVTFKIVKGTFVP